METQKEKRRFTPNKKSWKSPKSLVRGERVEKGKGSEFREKPRQKKKRLEEEKELGITPGEVFFSSRKEQKEMAIRE